MRSSSESYGRSSKKFSISGDTKDGDLISNLPECVLSHILSCLPIKDAVRTCVLSKVWEYKWTTIDNVIVEDRILFSNQKFAKASFMKFMDRILILLQNIKCFDLVCRRVSYNVSRVETWLCALFRNNVEVVSLCVTSPAAGFVLPRSLLYCTSLRKLVISMSCTLKVPVKFCFPNLTSLYLEYIQILNDNSGSDTLTFTFPVLATLEIRHCRWLKVRSVEFLAPCLSLVVYETIYGVNNDCLIKISGARIERFQVFGDDVENFLLTGSRVLRASLFLVDEMEEYVLNSGLGARKLLTELASISGLTLSCYTARVIAETKQGQPLPKFGKLGKLKLTGSNELTDHITNAEALFDLLHAMPFLNTLVMKGSYIFMQPHDDFDYDALMFVPSCIISHLKIVKFIFFSDEAPQLHLAMFLLKYGMKLIEFSFLDCLMDKNELEVLEGLISNTLKASSCVSIVIN